MIPAAAKGMARMARNTRVGTLPPRYGFILNPHAGTRLSKCPRCGKLTHPRKFAFLIHVDEEGELARVGELPAPRALTEASPGVRVEDEAVARRQRTDSRVPCHTSHPLRRSGNHLMPDIDLRTATLPEEESHRVGGRVRLSSGFDL